MNYFLFLLLLFNIERAALRFSPNINVKFEAFKPRGIRVTVPDNSFMLVSFSGTLNESGFNQKWQMYAAKPVNKLWILEDKNIEVKPGYTIYYDIHIVDISGLSYPIKGQWVATNISGIDETQSCVISKTEVQCGQKLCTGSLIFSEDFITTNAFIPTNLTKWQFEKYYPQEPDFPFNVYLSEAVTYVEDGLLKIKPMPTEELITRAFIDKSSGLNNFVRCTGEIGTSECFRIFSGYYIQPPVISAKITTRNSFNFKYGRIEIKARLPWGNWLIPEINLEPRYHEYGKLHYGSGIIRIAFSRGNREESYDLFGGPVVYDKEPQRSRFLMNSIGDNSWSNDFHIYSVIWRPESIEMLVDGERYGIFNSNLSYPYNLRPLEPNIRMQQDAWKLGAYLAPFDKMFYISLGVRVGGIHDFPDGDDKPWKNKSPKAMHEFAKNKNNWFPSWSTPDLVVDYVRVYAL